ncbi:Uncharacterised protein [Mycobacteroides abscessus]|nr:Uncharacterised protein [Mycobacteroides abscessus]
MPIHRCGSLGPALCCAVNASSRSAVASRPPSASVSAATFWGTSHVYCSALPSSKPS